MKKTLTLALLVFVAWMAAPAPAEAKDGHWRFLFRPFTWPAERIARPFRGGKVIKCSKKGVDPIVVVPKRTFKRFGPDSCDRYGEEVPELFGRRASKAINAAPGKGLKITKHGKVLKG